MDRHTLDKLEFERIRNLLSSQAQCALGRDLASRIQPSRRISQVHHWLEQGRQFGKWVDLHGLPPFGGIRDVREQVKRAVPPATLEPEDFADLAATLTGIGHVRTYLEGAGEDLPLLATLGTRLGDFQSIADRIGQAIDGRGHVRDNASDRLWRLRQNIDEVRQQTRDVFQKLLKQSSILKLLQYPNATFHADRMVLPVKIEQRGRLPGIVHRSSDSGQTVFIEPAQAVELNNTRINLLQAEREEIGRILWELTHIIHLNQKEILRTLETTAVVDLLTAKTKLALRFGMHNAELNDKQQIILRRARNPILLAAYEEEQRGSTTTHDVVPIDVRLGDDFDVMIITGPNTGGKTAALKTVGLLAVMTQSGLPIPANEGSTLPVFEDVWIDVGDEQSLVQSLSTFSAHLSQILNIIHKARKSTLVLLDEMGAGTDPDEGAAIGRAIIEHLLGSHCLAMVTTHLGSLKATGFELKRVDNASVLFDMQTLKPLYELRIGEPGNSNAIAIASRLGMPKKLVHTARRHLAGGHRALNRAIAGTLSARRSAERARRDADKARQDAARRALAAFDQQKSLQQEQAAYEAWVHRVINLKPGDEVRVRNFDAPGKIVHIRLEKQQVSVNLGQMQVDVPLANLILDGAAPGKAQRAP